MKVEITKGKLSINGTAVPLHAELAGFEKVLGKPFRISDTGAFRGVYWKELGIMCLQDPYGMKEIVNITFYFGGYWDVDQGYTSKPFVGSIILDGQPVTRGTDFIELSKKVSGLQQSDHRTWKIKYEDSTTVYLDGGAKDIQKVTIEKLR